MKCFRCLDKIDKKGEYYAINQYSKGIKIRTDYVHKKCWDKFMKSLDGASKSLEKSNFLLDALGSQLNKMGMIPDREIEIC